MLTPMLLVSFLLLLVSRTTQGDVPPTEAELSAYLTGQYETQASVICNKLSLANWDFTVDLGNAEKHEILLNVSRESADFDRKAWETWFRDSQWKTYHNVTTRRQMEILSTLGIAALSPESLDEYNKVRAAMSAIFGSARICPYDHRDCDVETDEMVLQGEIETVMAHSRNYDELEYVWSQWREASGAQIRTAYIDYVQLSNEAAVLNNYKDMGAMWRSDYDMPNLGNDVQRLWKQIQPLYLRLHAYTKEKLRKIYPQMPKGRYIPAHILGDLWAQQWSNVYDVLEPFPNATRVNITKSMIEQGFDVERMFTVANEFFTSLGLESMEMAYGSKAVVEEPSNSEMLCHASAWDFCDSKDFRISMCAGVNEEDLSIMHHELGHIQYYIQYKHQPITFRTSANPGFHEAMGDIIALSATTPQHYETIGLLRGYTETYENSINTLLRSALKKIAFLPFALALETWRYEVFSGVVPESKWNQRWWELTREYQLVDAPNTRSETDFDPGAKYHVAADSQYINYFISEIVQFQIHRALCIEAGQYTPLESQKKPLHTCDIYRSTAAGDKLREAMLVGSSEHWSEVLHKLTGETELNAKALLEYYEPLFDFLSNNMDLYIKATDPEDPVSQTVPIVVGAILGSVVICALVFYFVKQYRDKKKEDSVVETLAERSP